VKLSKLWVLDTGASIGGIKLSPQIYLDFIQISAELSYNQSFENLLKQQNFVRAFGSDIGCKEVTSETEGE
jgi:hypothetical protein